MTHEELVAAFMRYASAHAPSWLARLTIDGVTVYDRYARY